MTSDAERLSRQVASLLLKVARPLVWHDRVGGWPKQLHNGTCFFLRFERTIVGVTANHVIDLFESAVATNPYTVCQLSDLLGFDLLAAIIARDPRRDIATFEVPEPALDRIGATPLDCRGDWPPPEPQPGQVLSVCGFPELMRIAGPYLAVEFGVWGAHPAVQGVTRDEILITFDPIIAEPETWAAFPLVGSNLSGCSGGPAIMHTDLNGLHRWFPVALIAGGPREEEKQGAAGEFDMIRLRRIDSIRSDGSIEQLAEDTGWLPG